MDKLTCPYCERSFGLDEVENAELWQERAELAAALGPAWKLANEYVDCFRANHGTRMALKKHVRILREVAKLWQQGRFAFDGKKYRVREGHVIQALHDVCNADKVAFQNHNYLKRVLLKHAERLSEEGLTANEEEQREIKRRTEAAKGREQAEKEMTLKDWRKREGLESLGDLFK